MGFVMALHPALATMNNRRLFDLLACMLYRTGANIVPFITALTTLLWFVFDRFRQILLEVVAHD